MTIFFTSDTHFNQHTIIAYGGRPFSSVGEMDEALIERWNARVKPSDHIYHLGDVSMKRPRMVKHLVDRLNGHRRLIRGNHDIYHTKEYLDAGWNELYSMRYIDRIMFSHIALHPDSMGPYVANVHGHIHQHASPTPVMRLDKETSRVIWKPYVNISVEVTNYTPISFEEVKDRIKKDQQSLL